MVSNTAAYGMNASPFNVVLGVVPTTSKPQDPTFNANMVRISEEFSRLATFSSNGSPTGGPCLIFPLWFEFAWLADSLANMDFLQSGANYNINIGFNLGGVGALVQPFASNLGVPLQMGFLAPCEWVLDVVTLSHKEEALYNSMVAKGFRRAVTYSSCNIVPVATASSGGNLQFDLDSYTAPTGVFILALPAGALASSTTFSFLCSPAKITNSRLLVNTVPLIAEPINNPIRMYEMFRSFAPDAGMKGTSFAPLLGWTDFASWFPLSSFNTEPFLEDFGLAPQRLRVEFQMTTPIPCDIFVLVRQLKELEMVSHKGMLNINNTVA
jgi:hypothetical protein